MKPSLIYGCALAFSSILLVFALYFLGYHSNPEKLAAGQVIATVLNLALVITFIVLGMRATRATRSPEQGFSYGRALGAGIVVVATAAVIGTAFNFLYFNYINPGVHEMMVQAEVAKMEERGMSSEQIETAEKVMQALKHPAAQAISSLLSTMFTGTIIALIAAAFLKRRPEETAPTPPPLHS